MCINVLDKYNKTEGNKVNYALKIDKMWVMLWQ